MGTTTSSLTCCQVATIGRPMVCAAPSVVTSAPRFS